MKKIEPLFTSKARFNVELGDVIKVLESGSSEEKIRMLELLTDTNDDRIIQEIISRLGDDDIRVRGEAFSTLVLNENEISRFLIQGLKSHSKDIRAYSALILANREETKVIPEIVSMVDDEHSMVRACALGALGYLRAQDAGNAILQCLGDSNIEVRKSAVKAMIDIGKPLSEEMLQTVLQQRDYELERLVAQAKKSK